MMKIVIKKLFLVLFYLLFFFNLKSQIIASDNCYQTEFEWVSEKRLKLRFFLYRYNCGIKVLKDTFNFHLKINNFIKENVGQVVLDTFFLEKEFSCLGLSPCISQSNCNVFTCASKTTFVYEGYYDTDSTWLIDTMKNLNQCNLTFFMRSRRRYLDPLSNFYYDFIDNRSNLVFLEINNCLEWKKGDKSPKFRNTNPPESHYLKGYYGLKQLDFGCFVENDDSIVYKLSQPVVGNWETQSFNTPFSNNYYFESYCRNGAPCQARIDLNPPTGFYFNEKTGISTHVYQNSLHNINTYSMFLIDIYTYKLVNGKRELLGKTRRSLELNTTRLPLNQSLNKPIYFENLPLRRFACANKLDTIKFRIKDSLAINQTILDTISYTVFHDLPDGTYSEIQNIYNNKQIEIIWNPQIAKTWENPYIFNINANEQRCFLDREYVFRSCEFHVVQMPDFSIEKTDLNCGLYKLRAINNKTDDNNYSYTWKLTHQNGTIINNSGVQANFILNHDSFWNIELVVRNSVHGCVNTFNDTLFVTKASPNAQIYPRTKGCVGDSINLAANIKFFNSQPIYDWKIGNFQTNLNAFKYKINQNINIKLTLTDSLGCTATDSFLQEVFPKYALKPIKDTLKCYGRSAEVFALPNHFSDSILWLHNGKNNISQSIFNNGFYYIKYTDSNTCSAIDTFEVKSTNPLILNSYQDTHICKGNEIRFIAQINPDYNIQHTWFVSGNDFGNNSEINFLVLDTSLIQYIANAKIDYTNCTEINIFNIFAYPQSQTTLYIQSKDTCLNSNFVELNINNQQPNVSHTVHWGDGTVSNNPNPAKHQYSQTGIYEIKLVNTTQNSCVDSLNTHITIYENPSIEAFIYQNPICKNEDFIIATNPNALPHQVNYGDGNIKNLIPNDIVKHRYQQSGNYLVKISTQNQWCQTEKDSQITVFDLPKINTQLLPLCFGDSTLFSAEINSQITAYSWKINNLHYPQNPIKQMLTNTDNQVFLTTTTTNNCRQTDTFNVQLVEKPKAQFSLANLSENSLLRFKFINQSTGANSYDWWLNNQFESTETSPEIIFNDTGLVKIKLRSFNGNSCYDSTEKWLPIMPKIIFYLPNVVTKNNNNQNEYFGLEPTQQTWVTDYKIEIFNRWGGKVFESQQATDTWQAEVPIGIYIYKALITDIYGVVHSIKGVVEVVR